MTATDPTRFVGIDLGSKNNDVCIRAPGQGREEAEHRRFANTPEGIEELCGYLSDLVGGQVERVHVGAERPHGPVVEGLMRRGFAVFAVNPKQVDAFRTRYTVAEQKDDRLDAYLLAHCLETDPQVFRKVKFPDALLTLLAGLRSMHYDLTVEVGRLSSQIRAQLERYFPQILRLGTPREPWILSLLEAASTPEKAKALQGKEVADILKRHRIRRLKVDDVLSVLRTTPELLLAPGTVEAASRHVQMLIPRLRLALEQQASVYRDIQQTLRRLEEKERAEDDGRPQTVTIVRSMPGVGPLVAATLLAEAPQAIADKDYKVLRAQSGQAPVTRRSGGKIRVHRRWACNPMLTEALYHWSRVAVQKDPYWRAAYAALRARGHWHARALRTIGDRLLRVLCAALRDATLYDPTRLKAAA